MFNRVITLLLSQVLADCWYDKKRCQEDLSCSNDKDSCSDSNYWNCFDFGPNKRKEGCCISGPYSKYPGDLTRDFNDPVAVKQLSNLLPFVSSYTAVPSRQFLPYVEFANIAEFFAIIPNKDTILPLYLNVDIAALIKLACNTKCFENYEAYLALFYNADALSGICTREFDDNFILFFLVRFLYFLDLFQCENPCKFRDNCIWSCDWTKKIDLLNIPASYANLTFGTRENALRLFNKIITDTVLTKYLVQVIICIVKQLECVEASHAKCFKLPPFTTLSTYVILLRSYLLRTAAISEFNYKIKLEYLIENKVFAFIQIPVKLAREDELLGAEPLAPSSESEDALQAAPESQGNEEEVSDAIFVEILDFYNNPKCRSSEIRSNNIAVYTKAGLARFL